MKVILQDHAKVRLSYKNLQKKAYLASILQYPTRTNLTRITKNSMFKLGKKTLD